MSGWTIVGIFPGVNGQHKAICRNGSRVLHVDRLSAEAAATFGPAEAAAAWARR